VRSIGIASKSFSPSLVIFHAHALLIVEERLREQEAGELPPEMDATDFAIRLLVAAELSSRG